MRNVLWFVSAVCLGVVLVAVGLQFLNQPRTLSTTLTPTSTPQAKSDFTLDMAPSQSLKGQLTNVQGEVAWQDRTATEAAQITNPQTIQQGESLSTAKGSATLVFENALSMQLQAKTAVNVVQTLPANIVLAQSQGSIHYLKLGAIPVSVRSLHLLIEIQGDALVTLTNELITIKGPVTVAYNDSKNISKIVTTEAGQTLTFNDDTRRVVVR